MIAARLLELPFIEAFIICYIGNMLPIPFILMFIRKIFKWMRKYKAFAKETVAPYHTGQDSHMTVNYELLLELGICGIKERIKAFSPEFTELYIHSLGIP